MTSPSTPAPPDPTPQLSAARVIDFLEDEGCLSLGHSRADGLGDEVVITPVDTDLMRGGWIASAMPEDDGEVPEDDELRRFEPRWFIDDPEFEEAIQRALREGRLPEWARVPPGPKSELWSRDQEDEGGTRWGGWERCAWYAPLHTAGPAWGIYMREECLRKMAVDIAVFTGLASRRAGVRPPHLPSQVFSAAAFAALYLHEDFHHRVESFAIRLHVASRTPHYLRYARDVYRHTYWSDANLEEALANASMWRRRGEIAYSRGLPKSVRDGLALYLATRIPRDPPGYRRGDQYFADGAWRTGINTLAAQVEHETISVSKPDVVRWEAAPRMFSPLFSLSHRIYTVIPIGSRSVLPTPTHPSPDCSSRKLIRAVARRGYAETRGGKGSHAKFKRDGSPTLIIPGNQKSLSPGVIATTLDAFGMKLPDLQEFLGEA